MKTTTAPENEARDSFDHGRRYRPGAGAMIIDIQRVGSAKFMDLLHVGQDIRRSRIQIYLIILVPGFRILAMACNHRKSCGREASNSKIQGHRNDANMLRFVGTI